MDSIKKLLKNSSTILKERNGNFSESTPSSPKTKVLGENTPEPEVHIIGFIGSKNQSKLLQKRMFLRNIKKNVSNIDRPCAKNQ